MGFSEAISVCFKKYACFHGRASRSEYWWWWLFTFVVGLVAGVLDNAFGTWKVIALLSSLALLLPSWGVAVRRYHDCGHSGWWIICPIMNFVFLFFNSVDEGNPYTEE